MFHQRFETSTLWPHLCSYCCYKWYQSPPWTLKLLLVVDKKLRTQNVRWKEFGVFSSVLYKATAARKIDSVSLTALHVVRLYWKLLVLKILLFIAKPFITPSIPCRLSHLIMLLSTQPQSFITPTFPTNQSLPSPPTKPTLLNHKQPNSTTSSHTKPQPTTPTHTKHRPHHYFSGIVIMAMMYALKSKWSRNL